jgi:hypothetical protein
MTDNNEDFNDWIQDLEEAEQPKCSIENPEECDSCGS